MTKGIKMNTIMIKNSFLVPVIGICIFMSITVCSCRDKNDYDGAEYLTTIAIDSLETEIRLDDIYNGGYIAVNGRNKYEYQELWERDDLRYLPYIYLALGERYLPRPIAQRYNQIIIDMCGYSANDSVYWFGKLFSDRLRDKYYEVCESDPGFHMRKYPERGKTIKRKPSVGQIEGKMYNLDSLRISVIGYNDRNALALLEKYYKDIDMGKELAAYYKVMLGFEGNGDLAERYFEVLEPYLAEQPEFYGGIKEVLLRAALCDHNNRAQELCDSLGISLCDYRLPLPE